MFVPFSLGPVSRACARRVVALLLGLGLLFGVGSGQSAAGQTLRADAGSGWAFPTNNLDLRRTVSEGPNSTRPIRLEVDLKGGPHAYADVGFLRSIGEKFDLGARIRGHVSRIRSEADCGTADCRNPEGLLRAATVEGRVILTSPGWIQPYLLVGLGVVHTRLHQVTVRNIQASGVPEPLTFSEVSVVDAGGDVGIGATLPVAGGLAVDAEIRATGSLPGGKENAVTAIPFSLGIAYNVQ